ncbi:hypothetical protein P7K49_031811 [Saguinus oedipus]|uniref:Uncharacterized protein n=1 Tax=Saguinus oedipus TaxID=9490 RepID=A0ABQ9U0H2_SAGOE|nr:hypothetical protein P7K49_031811 [Saguinus oedipus]
MGEYKGECEIEVSTVNGSVSLEQWIPQLPLPHSSSAGPSARQHQHRMRNRIATFGGWLTRAQKSMQQQIWLGPTEAFRCRVCLK